MDDVRVVWDEAAVKIFAEAEDGPVGRAMSRLADGVVSSMKFRCPVSPWDSGRSGTLRSSIQKFRLTDGSYLIGPTAKTDDGTPLGPLLENGTRPHVIESHGPWPLRNRRTGEVFGRVVHHPGTRAQKFIEPAAHDLPPRIDI
jgi:hypothetical protein